MPYSTLASGGDSADYMTFPRPGKTAVMQSWRKRGTVTILVVSVINIMQAGLVLFYPVAVGATPLLGVYYAFYYSLNLERAAIVVPAILIPFSLLALIGAFCRVGKMRIWMILGQNLSLGAMGVGGIAAACFGHYLDNTVIPWPHILADQILIFGFFLVHNHAMVRRCRERD